MSPELAMISAPGFDASSWLPVTADDAGAVGTEVEALLQNGVCPDDPSLEPINQSTDSQSSVFYSNNMQLCFGNPQTSIGADSNPLFDVPWWFRTDFTASLRSGQDANAPAYRQTPWRRTKRRAGASAQPRLHRVAPASERANVQSRSDAD